MIGLLCFPSVKVVLSGRYQVDISPQRVDNKDKTIHFGHSAIAKVKKSKFSAAYPNNLLYLCTLICIRRNEIAKNYKEYYQ